MADFYNLDQARAALDRRCITASAGELPALVADAQCALIASHAGIYQRGGSLVRIIRLDEDRADHGIARRKGAVMILPVTRDWLHLAIARACDWQRFDGRTKSNRRIDPPPSIASGLLALAGEWRFPALRGTVSAPTLRRDGSLLAAPGYDSASQLFATFADGEFPPITPTPNRDDAQAALDTLDDLFLECAFSGGDRSANAAVAIACVLTAVSRHALSTAPLFGFNAHQAGSGKTTLAKAAAQIATGCDPAVLAPAGDENELRKSLLATLIAGDNCVLIDNQQLPVESAALCAALTSETYSDRILGASQKATVPTSVTLLITGNALTFVGDLTSRAVQSTLDPECEHPESREFKRDLPAFVAEHRAKLVAAALTIGLAFAAAGSPRPSAARSRFSDWDRLVRFPLLWLGCADPLATQADLCGTDPERESLVVILEAWQTAFGSSVQTVATAVEAANAPGQSGNPVLLEALQAVAGDRMGAINTRRLGRYLVRNQRRIERGLRIELCGADPLTHTRRFRVAAIASRGTL